MSSIDSQLTVTGGISQALVSALDQVYSLIEAGLTGPDGQPDGTAVYMHLPVGISVDPRQYANPWSPMGGSSAAKVANDGRIPDAVPTTEVAATVAKVQAPGPDPQLQQSLFTAFMTSRLVDDMLMVTKDGVAQSWPNRTMSIEYFTILAGMQAEPVPPMAEDVKARVDAANALLYRPLAEGGGKTDMYAVYNKNKTALELARSDYAMQFAKAMHDPDLGQVWPNVSATYQDVVDQARSQLAAQGQQQIEDALHTLQSVGGSGSAALIDMARNLYSAYSMGLAGSTAVKVPWSYISPMSWWDHTNQDFGVEKITATSNSYQTGGNSGGRYFAHQFYENSASSNSGSAGFSCFGFGAAANASHSEQNHNDGQHSDSSNWNSYHDSSSTASVSFEWFLAQIERPWFLGDLFHMGGWYMVGQEKDTISDGTIDGQIDKPDRLMPMVPKAFLVIRNVTITADSFGDAGSALSAAQNDANAHSDSSSTSFGGSVGWFGLGGSFDHSESDSHGDSTQSGSNSASWSYESSGAGGTLTISGSQICGWIGQIQPPAPMVDAPKDAKADPLTPAMAAAAPVTTAAPAPVSAPETTPAPAPADPPSAPAPADPLPAAPPA